MTAPPASSILMEFKECTFSCGKWKWQLGFCKHASQKLLIDVISTAVHPYLISELLLPALKSRSDDPAASGRLVAPKVELSNMTY